MVAMPCCVVPFVLSPCELLVCSTAGDPDWIVRAIRREGHQNSLSYPEGGLLHLLQPSRCFHFISYNNISKETRAAMP
ncbi:hypothetical protein K458DRAFT_141266 [Lentithecium fluviatile CBS 122367]|uniref:Secreted protein n=1 Tax=Lentithecium fluviatile CBS 122367 TaxID=1168545 RepID=A0A6G1IIP8_9PLEO|nr:hypothetical protein K458DRAFT_141266 [Lentithecium fluviatile CBS 122367]